MEIGILIIALFIIGCTTSLRPVGEENFDCAGKKSTNPYCRSVRGVDASTQGDLPKSAYDAAYNYDDFSKYQGELPADQKSAKPANLTTPVPKANETRSTAQAPAPTLLPHEQLDAPPVPGAPVRQAEQIQKVWVNRHQDGNGKLHQPQELFQTVAAARWTGAAPVTTQQNGTSYPHVAIEPMSKPNPGTAEDNSIPSSIGINEGNSAELNNPR